MQCQHSTHPLADPQSSTTINSIQQKEQGRDLRSWQGVDHSVLKQKLKEQVHVTIKSISFL